MDALARLSAATTALAEARTLDDVKRILDIAEAARTYARAAKLGLEAANHAAEIKLRAERKAGELLAQLERGSGGDRKSDLFKNQMSQPVTFDSEYGAVLSENDINRQTAHRWQTVATVPDEVFEQHVTEIKSAAKELSTAGLLQIAKDLKRQEKREGIIRAIENLPAPPSINGELATNTIAVADVAELIDLLPAESVDMIFTDPPYHDEYVDLYGNLAALAAHVLKPGGYLMTYIGKMFMPDVMCQLARHLEYVSIYAVFQPFSTSRIVKHNIFENWRPILAYKKPGKTAVREWAQDVVRGTRDKEFHDWQQDEQAPEQYIASYTKPGDLVLDPFCGGGTTAAVCKRIGRYYLSFDTNPDAVKIALSRLEVTRG